MHNNQEWEREKEGEKPIAFHVNLDIFHYLFRSCTIHIKSSIFSPFTHCWSFKFPCVHAFNSHTPFSLQYLCVLFDLKIYRFNIHSFCNVYKWDYVDSKMHFAATFEIMKYLTNYLEWYSSIFVSILSLNEQKTENRCFLNESTTNIWILEHIRWPSQCQKSMENALF